MEIVLKIIGVGIIGDVLYLLFGYPGCFIVAIFLAAIFIFYKIENNKEEKLKEINNILNQEVKEAEEIDYINLNRLFEKLSIDVQIEGKQEYHEYIEKIENDLINSFNELDYLKIERIEQFFAKYLPSTYSKHNDEFSTIKNLKNFLICEKCLMYDSNSNSVNTILINEIKTKTQTNLVKTSIQKMLWLETFRENFNIYSYRTIRDSIYNTLPKKTSMEISLSEEYVIKIHNANIQRKVNVLDLQNSLTNDEYYIYNKCLEYINTQKEIKNG